jgi:hypothetical protein
MLIQGVVGQPSAYPDSPTPAIVRIGDLGEIIVSELHGAHYEQAYRKNMFTCSSQAGATTTVGFATTYTGLCLSNPLASTVNLAINKVAVAFLVAFPAAAAIGMMAGNSATNVTHTTPGTIYSSNIGSGAVSQARVDVAATLPATPVLHSMFGSGLTGAITTAVDSAPMVVEYNGSIIVPPGSFVALFTSTASGVAAMWASFEWEEIPAA